MTDDEFRDRIVQTTADFMLERFFKVNPKPEAFYVACCFALAARSTACFLSTQPDPSASVETLAGDFAAQLRAHILAAAADAEALPPPATLTRRMLH